MGSSHEIGWESNTGFHQWALDSGRWAAHSLRVRHSEQRLRITIIPRCEGPGFFIRDLSPDSVGCVGLYRIETTRFTRHQEGGFDSESVMEMAVARASRRTGLELLGSAP